MSADNWAVCPKCLAADVAEYEARADKFAAAYGKVPEDEYKRLRDEVGDHPTQADREPTFREDYDIGTSGDGVFVVSYRGGCANCDLNHTFNHRNQIYAKESANG
jgi:hypothetical protein